jgi:hypothetical protein
MRPLRTVLVLLLAGIPFGVLAADPDVPAFPAIPPVRERVFSADDHAGWTLRRGDAAAPLSVASTPGRTVVALAGGFVVLGADLEVLPSSIDLLASDGPAGSPWTQAVGDAVIFVTGTPGDMAVLYPDAAVVLKTPLELENLSQIALTDTGLFFVQGRRTSTAPSWDARVREGQPLPFFPADVTASADGTPWAADSLQARPWRVEDGFWKPLDVPKTPGRLLAIAPFPDSSGYFASGAGWVGAFSSDGTMFWLKDKDGAGKPLPIDLKIRAGAGRLYLWSALARKVWCWGWDAEGPAGSSGGLSGDDLSSAVRSEIARLTALGSVPEAASVAQYGVELAQTALKTQPLSSPWQKLLAEFGDTRRSLRDRVVGAGVLKISWDAPFGKPLASWTWEPDASLADVKAWRASSRPFWEGRPYEADDFKLALTADRAPWPGIDDFRQGSLRLPSWMNVELRPDGTDVPVHWARVRLPAPAIPYDLPTE